MSGKPQTSVRPSAGRPSWILNETPGTLPSRFAQNLYRPKTRIPKRISEAGGVSPEDPVAPSAYIRQAMSVTTHRKKISGLSYDPSHWGRGATRARAYLVLPPACRGGVSLISHRRPFPATTCVDVQTKTSVAEQRSAGKPPDLGNADPVAAQLDLTRPFADQQNRQIRTSRDTSSDRFRANFPRRCPGNIGFLGSGPKFVAFRTLYERVFAVDCLVMFEKTLQNLIEVFTVRLSQPVARGLVLVPAVAFARGGGAPSSVRDVGRRGARLEKQPHSGLMGPRAPNHLRSGWSRHVILGFQVAARCSGADC